MELSPLFPVPVILILLGDVNNNENCRMDNGTLHCYFELSTYVKLSPKQARTACPAGSHLATITSREEIAFLFSLKCKKIIFPLSCNCVKLRGIFVLKSSNIYN